MLTKGKKFGGSINSIWNHLIVTWNNSLSCEGCYSHIDVPYPFSIAGSSFWYLSLFFFFVSFPLLIFSLPFFFHLVKGVLLLGHVLGA